ncbi:hypothetical protein YSY43_22070 [Paenibacillus sp. YSY-4.3]
MAEKSNKLRRPRYVPMQPNKCNGCIWGPGQEQNSFVVSKLCVASISIAYLSMCLEINNKMKEDMAMNQSTKELTKELAGREGIEVIKVNPHEEFKITTGQKEMKLTGPAIILINQD